jgi:hypothetical protein
MSRSEKRRGRKKPGTPAARRSTKSKKRAAIPLTAVQATRSIASTSGRVAHTDSPRFDDRLKTILAAAANLAFLLTLVGMWILEKPLFHRHQLSGSSLLIYTIGALSLIVYYGLRVVSDNIRTLFELLWQAVRAGVRDSTYARRSKKTTTPGHGFPAGLRIPVTFNFWLVGWLIYASGGLTNSPYSGVPIVMVLLGQSMYDVPPITLQSRRGIPPLASFGWSVAKIYGSSLSVVISLLATLVALQHWCPRVTSAAPTGETVAMMIVSLFASVCVTFVTRKADQHRT